MYKLLLLFFYLIMRCSIKLYGVLEEALKLE
ncbi:hypothetical protein Misp06_02624 [Microbulbifer sp. NBRC 101763]